jgi:pimeloyl-ACP methyl ester carboxylesterase
LGPDANDGTIFQAGINLPYYLGIPTASDPSALNSTWQASMTVGGIIDAGAGNEAGTTPPSDKVTFRFPFAEEQGSVFAPLLISVPDDTACGAAKPYDVVIYQHGIFGNRSHSLALGNQLAGACFVTVAMDLPLHGIAPKLATGSLDPALAFSVDVTQSEGTFIESPLPMNERHFGWGQAADGTPTRMEYATDAADAVGSSAQFFLNLANLPAARDNNRQGVVDLLNLNASLVELNDIDLDNSDLDGDPTTRLDAQRDVNVQPDGSGGSKVYFVGHSLGGILGTSFVALANEAAQASTIGNTNIVPITAAALVTPGAGIAKLLENSPSIGSTVLAGLAASGLTQGTSNLELFLNVAQASLDSAEPHNFVSSLLNSGSKVYLNEIYGDGSTKTTQDQTIPIAADTAYAGQYSAPLGAALPAPLAGTEPLVAQLEADTRTANGTTAENTNVVRFTSGTHTTIIQPSTTEGPAVFADMATNIISFFSTDGEEINFNNGVYVKQNEPSPSNP